MILKKVTSKEVETLAGLVFSSFARKEIVMELYPRVSDKEK